MPMPGRSQKHKSLDSLAKSFPKEEISGNTCIGMPESCHTSWSREGLRSKNKARARSISRRARSSCFAGYRLFDFDVIARVNTRRAVGDKYGRRVAAHVENYAFSQHFSRQIVPIIPTRRTAKAIQTVLKPLGLGSKLRERTLITEYPKIVAHFYAFVGAQVHVERVALPRRLLIIPRLNDHRDWLAAYGS